MNKSTDSSERRLPVSREIQIKAYEIDAMGIVSNINYIKYFEDIRTDFLEKYYPYPEMMEAGISPILMHTEIDYKIPLTIYDRPTIYSWVSKMEGMRWEFRFEIKSGEKLHAAGLQRGSFFDIEKKRPVRIPGKLMDAWTMDLTPMKS